MCSLQMPSILASVHTWKELHSFHYKICKIKISSRLIVRVLWPVFKCCPHIYPFCSYSVDLASVEYGKYVEDDFHHSFTSPDIPEHGSKRKGTQQKGKPGLTRLYSMFT